MLNKSHFENIRRNKTLLQVVVQSYGGGVKKYSLSVLGA